MAENPIPFSSIPGAQRADNPTDPTLGLTLMGWNQLVKIIAGSNRYLGGSLGPFGDPGSPLRVSGYDIGVKQEGNAPDYITGRQDRSAWMKGPIESQGTLEYPFTFRTGIAMFSAGASLVFNPGESFEIESSAHPKLRGCKINTVNISCNAREEIKTRAEVWGIVDTLENTLIDTEEFDPLNPGYTNLLDVSSADGDQARRTVGVGFGNIQGITTTGFPNLILEQIPQWDVVRIEGAPTGMHVVGFTLDIANNLIRNYTMGDNTGASPFGLNATSISANQRRVSGTLQWQSNMDGTIAQILGTGLETLIITIFSPEGPFVLQMNNCLWNAVAPRLSATDRVVVETSFTALGANEEEFDALRITLPNGIILDENV